MLAVIGTRPEVIKMAPVISALRARDGEVLSRVAFTGQHTTLVDRVLGAFELSADYDLAIMRDGQSVYDVVHGTLDGLRRVVEEFRPDLLLVQGDTASVFAASLVGFLERVPVGHVEAGLRSGDKAAPFPEEVLRRLTDVVADQHFAPTTRARDLLLSEGAPPEHVHVTGNTVVDALLRVAVVRRPVQDETLRAVIESERRLVLLTAHRRESFGAPMRGLFRAVREMADAVDDIDVVYPVHPNPHVVEAARVELSGHDRIRLVEPLDYFDLVAALRAASLVLTDSGGIQEEAPTFGVPVLVLRDVTERPEGIEAGVARLVGTDPKRVLEAGLEALSGAGRASAGTNPYGDGRAGERIADIVVSTLTGRPRATSDWA